MDLSQVKDYPYIVKWGIDVMGSGRSYIAEQVLKAREAKAPANATHEIHDEPGTWSTTDDISNGSVRITLGLEPLAPTAPAALASYHGEITQKNRATGVDNFWYVITFPNMASAARWTEAYKISARVRPKYTGRFFDQPVTVEYQPE